MEMIHRVGGRVQLPFLLLKKIGETKEVYMTMPVK